MSSAAAYLHACRHSCPPYRNGMFVPCQTEPICWGGRGVSVTSCAAGLGRHAMPAGAAGPCTQVLAIPKEVPCYTLP